MLCLDVEGRQDGTWSIVGSSAFARQPLERATSVAKLLDLGIEDLDAGVGEFPDPAAVAPGVEREQLFDLFEGKACRLSLFDEPQAPDVLLSIVPEANLARRRPEQPFSLIKSYGLDTDIARCGKLADREGDGLLTLYHGTDAISLLAQLQGDRKCRPHTKLPRRLADEMRFRT